MTKVIYFNVKTPMINPNKADNQKVVLYKALSEDYLARTFREVLNHVSIEDADDINPAYQGVEREAAKNLASCLTNQPRSGDYPVFRLVHKKNDEQSRFVELDEVVSSYSPGYLFDASIPGKDDKVKMMYLEVSIHVTGGRV